MFTGLIQAVGKVYPQGKSLRVEGCEVFSPLRLGDSIAVDGVCLTVIECSFQNFLADVSEETLKRTTLGIKGKRNNFVNLEPALKLTDRLGGHLVTGHIDGLGEIISINELNNSWDIEVSWKDIKYGRYICEKGSICLNGISLTVAEYWDDGTRFSIAVIPHTWFATSLQYLVVGDLVNLEIDLMAKYAERLLSQYEFKQLPKNLISKDWLHDQGWS